MSFLLVSGVTGPQDGESDAAVRFPESGRTGPGELLTASDWGGSVFSGPQHTSVLTSDI